MNVILPSLPMKLSEFDVFIQPYIVLLNYIAYIIDKQKDVRDRLKINIEMYLAVLVNLCDVIHNRNMICINKYNSIMVLIINNNFSVIPYVDFLQMIYKSLNVSESYVDSLYIVWLKDIKKIEKSHKYYKHYHVIHSIIFIINQYVIRCKKSKNLNAEYRDCKFYVNMMKCGYELIIETDVINEIKEMIKNLSDIFDSFMKNDENFLDILDITFTTNEIELPFNKIRCTSFTNNHNL
jgi:hypothetical protein